MKAGKLWLLLSISLVILIAVMIRWGYLRSNVKFSSSCTSSDWVNHSFFAGGSEENSIEFFKMLNQFTSRLECPRSGHQRKRMKLE